MTDTREFIRESNAIEDVHDESALDDSVAALEYLQAQETLTHDRLKRTHELIIENRQPRLAGTYRTVPVYIGDSIPTPSGLVELEMERLLQWEPADPLEVVESHVAFEQIHPFEDGNGRVGRLVYRRYKATAPGLDPVEEADNSVHKPRYEGRPTPNY